MEEIIVHCYGNRLLRNTITLTIRKISTGFNPVRRYPLWLPCLSARLLFFKWLLSLLNPNTLDTAQSVVAFWQLSSKLSCADLINAQHLVYFVTQLLFYGKFSRYNRSGIFGGCTMNVWLEDLKGNPLPDYPVAAFCGLHSLMWIINKNGQHYIGWISLFAVNVGGKKRLFAVSWIMFASRYR
jgi:hypothetical protein